MHTLPGNANVLLVDLPGGATDKQPAKTYCRHSCLDQADVVVHCFTERFSELDRDISQTAQALGIPLILVYTKTDVGTSNDARRSGGIERQVKDQLVQRVTQDICASLPAMAGPDGDLYFVDSLNLQAAEYDGKRLLSALLAL